MHLTFFSSLEAAALIFVHWGKGTMADLAAQAHRDFEAGMTAYAAYGSSCRLLGARPAPAASRFRLVVGRNVPCPCGSGRKYKKCCGLARWLTHAFAFTGFALSAW